MTVSLAGQAALVVGASSGIGRSIAAHFCREGAHVLASARRKERLEELRDEMTAENCILEIYSADATQPDKMEALARFAKARFGKIDILVYASGTNTPDRAMSRLSVPIWNMMVQVNLNGAYYATAAVLPAMREARSGHLIYISSISGLIPDASGAAYQAAKRGLLGLAHATRLEEKENGIRTCVVCPGLTETEILEKRPTKPSTEMLKHALQPDDIAAAVLAVAKLPPRAAVPEMQILPAYL